MFIFSVPDDVAKRSTATDFFETLSVDRLEVLRLTAWVVPDRLGIWRPSYAASVDPGRVRLVT
jgi:hypothetical protein